MSHDQSGTQGHTWPLDLDITFNRDYLARHFGAVYDERYFTDWHHRVATDMQVQRGLYERFEDLGLGSPEPQPRVRLGFDDTLNLTLLFGSSWEVKGGISWIRPGVLANLESIMRLGVPDPEQTWPNTFLVQQYREAVAELGAEHVTPPRPHGVLEAALDLRGEQLLLDFHDAPALAHRLFAVLTEAVIRFQEFWLGLRGGQPWEEIVLGGCATTMLSASKFERFVLPCYQRLSRHFRGGFLCACGPCTHLLASFARLHDCRYFRVGWGTDLSRARSELGARHIKASLDPARVTRQSADEVREDVRKTIECAGRGGPLSVLLIHAGADMPDANIRAVYEVVADCGGRLAAAPRAP